MVRSISHLFLNSETPTGSPVGQERLHSHLPVMQLVERSVGGNERVAHGSHSGWRIEVVVDAVSDECKDEQDEDEDDRGLGG